MNIDSILGEVLKEHIGHNVRIVSYGDKDIPQDICLECEDCQEILISTESFELENITTFNKNRAEQILIDNGIDEDEVKIVLQALGYAFDIELYPEIMEM